MSVANAGKFSCSACGKHYSWKAELAGRRVKCKCGVPITVPKDDPAAEVQPPDFDDLYALAEGTPVAEAAVTPPPFNRAAAAPAAASRPSRSPGVAATAPAVASSGRSNPMLGYAQMAPKRRAADDENPRGGDVFFHPVKDLYIPGGLIVAGTIITYLIMVFHSGVNPGVAIVAVGLLCLINVILTVPGILLTIKMFDLGIGPIGPGIVKLAACAIVPGAIGDAVAWAIGGAFSGYIGWVVTYLLTLVLFSKLLEMDFGETLTCSSIIFVIRTWIGTAIMIALLNSFGFGGIPGAMIGAGGGGGGGRTTLSGEVDDNGDDSLDAIHARDSDEFMIHKLHGGGVDGKEWIEKDESHVLAGLPRDKSLRAVRDLYAAGASEVRVYPHKNKAGREVAETLIIVAPTDAGARGKCVEQLKGLAKQLGRAKFRDRGEKYWPVELLTGDAHRKEFGSPFDEDDAPKPVKKGAKAKPGADDEDDDGDQ
jgi:hypothetical protein